MKLAQYYRCLDLLKAGMNVCDIQVDTHLPISTVMKMESGARIAPYLLLHTTKQYELCPRCGRKVHMPCYICFLETHPDATCIEVIPRPIENQDEPLTVSLDVDLLNEEE